MSVEVEAKLRVESFAPIHAALKAMAAEPLGTVLERNWILDATGHALLKKGMLLRIRTTGGLGGVLTVKGPSVKGTAFKTREEREVTVSDHAAALRQFEMLGYVVDWIYEKVRETWRVGACTVELDYCPGIGRFVEIEGEPDAIHKLAGALGLNADDHVREGYIGLWRAHLEALGQAKRNMVFTEAEREAILRGNLME